MAAISPLLRPLGIATAAIASFEALAWGIMSLLGLLTCTKVMKANTTNPKTSELLTLGLVEVLINEDYSLPLMIANLVVNIVWLISSGIMFHALVMNKKSLHIVLLGWSTVTGAVFLVDGAGTITFGLEYGRRKEEVDNSVVEKELALPYMLAPLILLILSARGFVMMLFNLAALSYFGEMAKKLRGDSKKGTMKNMAKTFVTTARRLSDVPSLQSFAEADKDLFSSENPMFQPDTLSAWNIQSPTVGDARRGPWSFPDNSSPKHQHVQTKILPRIGRPVSAPMAPVSPLPIPQPDYSPPMRRPVKHEPNLYDAPLRSALKKPNQLGRTIL